MPLLRKKIKGITESFTYIANLVYKKVEENKKKNIKIGGDEKPKKNVVKYKNLHNDFMFNFL